MKAKIGSTDALAKPNKQGVTEEHQDPSGTITLGEWYWVEQWKTEYGEAEDVDGLRERKEVMTGERKLACVTRLGSNYAELTYVGTATCRIHFDTFWEFCKHEPEWRLFVDTQIKQLQQELYNALQQTKDIIESLGLHAPETSKSDTALATMSSARSVDAHKKALVRAKEKTLPELQDRVKKTNEQLGLWLAAPSLPLRAQSVDIRDVIKRIDGQLFNVELYAGLVESVVQVRKGQPAPFGKLHLMQRMHYMDEECLIDYEAGGMTYESIGAFDRWLSRKAIFERIFPFERCVVAFRVRRHDHRNFLTGHVALHVGKDPDKTTFLYIRNGGQLHRLNTSLDFKHRMFPERKDLLIGGDKLYVKREFDKCEFKSEADYLAMVAEYKKIPKKERWHHHNLEPWRWSEFTPSDVYFDEMNAGLKGNVEHANRVALVLQGLFDRSEALHPHPPIQLWNAEGFAAAIELVYDVDMSLTDGAAPDFEAYRSRLNASLKVGSMTVGQEDAWMRVEAKKENERTRYQRHSITYERFQPYGNPGPGLIAEVQRFGTRSKVCTYRWKRERERYVEEWRRGPDYEEMILCSITLPSVGPEVEILNVDAYQLGDYKQFYADPRTREDYLQWAPLLLAAEDYKAGKYKPEETP